MSNGNIVIDREMRYGQAIVNGDDKAVRDLLDEYKSEEEFLAGHINTAKIADVIEGMMIARSREKGLSSHG